LKWRQGKRSRFHGSAAAGEPSRTEAAVACSPGLENGTQAGASEDADADTDAASGGADIPAAASVRESEALFRFSCGFGFVVMIRPRGDGIGRPIL
jgi:hypothetical protein